MRHFLVLGFASSSDKAKGKTIHLGSDRSKAIEEVNKESKQYKRRELYELATPQMRRHSAPVEPKKDAK